MSVPDPIANPGDLIVVDHVSHFSTASLERALSAAGFGSLKYDRKGFMGAIVATAKAGGAVSINSNDPLRAAAEFADIGKLWTEISSRLKKIANRLKDRRSAIYGAGVYGSFIANRIRSSTDIVCFIDRNPHLGAHLHMGLPVLAPNKLPPEVEVIYAGLNPTTARAILADIPEWRGRALEIVYLV